MKDKKESIRIALLVSCACVLQVAESLIPHPVPGIRLGLANLITLVALVNIGFRVSLQIALTRVLISSFVLGTFLSPSFMLSFSGALVSTLLMGLFFKLSTGGKRAWFSIIGISVIGSLGHNITQISLAYLLLVKNSAIFLLWPWLLISGLIMGWITGQIAIQVCRKLDSSFLFVPVQTCKLGEPSSPPGSYVHRCSPMHLMSPQIKIMGVFLLALIFLFYVNYWIYASVFCFLLALTLLSRLPFPSLFSGIGKLFSIIFLSFLLPCLFTPGRILVSMGSLQITQQGLEMGISFASRIVLLYLTASLLARTTSPREIASGLERLLFPLKIFKLSTHELANVLTLSWSFFPVFWKEAGNMLREQKYELKKLRNLIGLSSDLVVGLYGRAEQIYNHTDPTNDLK
jgi:heptaprenyl diphosphate synthase